MIKEFRDFIARGNVIDLAVGIIIGAAFTAIVNSLVSDLIMPILGIVIGQVSFSAWTIPVGEAQIRIGAFIDAGVQFLIIAFVVFMLVRTINRFSKKKEEAPAPSTPPPPTTEELTLQALNKLNATLDRMGGAGGSNPPSEKYDNPAKG
ncbi:MAG: large conductance mechanosensitive channel protein MscL [Anaerolineae bacterium]|nr:large conductance mechanosensitive channel protein MscL [Anaerolineae bacterium]